jgi:hypothetical protein
MKIFASLVAATALIVSVAPSQAAVDVGVSVQISQPGVYGRVDIGRYPQPAVIVQQPVWVARPVQPVPVVQPIYMWVPPGHQKHWHKHCGRYGACGAPVYFVQDRWYQQQVMVREHRGHGEWRGDGRGDGRGEWRERDRGHDRRH